LIGFRGDFLTATKGTGLFNTLFLRFGPWQGALPRRMNGALVADREGMVTPYALYNLQERGIMFISPGTMVYEGMVVGENNRSDDLNVNVVKEKKQTNMRASNSDETVKLIPPRPMSLDGCLEFIDNSELVEITPKNIRIRKRSLQQNQRLREISREKNSDR
ncbi:MAG: translational GTPase TypA, partial [Armatimonadota bacterium]|nr:translational GTPase TypA [Armatimonadota bacterium]